jgi:hypothetical protein
MGSRYMTGFFAQPPKKVHFRASIMASATPQLPLARATALQHCRQNGCEDADVRLRGHEMSETIRKRCNFT